MHFVFFFFEKRIESTSGSESSQNQTALCAPQLCQPTLGPIPAQRQSPSTSSGGSVFPCFPWQCQSSNEEATVRAAVQTIMPLHRIGQSLASSKALRCVPGQWAVCSQTSADTRCARRRVPRHSGHVRSFLLSSVCVPPSSVAAPRLGVPSCCEPHAMVC